jgi:hypothetical protein
MTAYAADAHAYVLRLVKMATVSTLPKSNVLLCVFCAQKDPKQRIFINKCFLFTVESVCRVKRFTIVWRNSLKDVPKSLMMPD